MALFRATCGFLAGGLLDLIDLRAPFIFTTIRLAFRLVMLGKVFCVFVVLLTLLMDLLTELGVEIFDLTWILESEQSQPTPHAF